MSGQAEEILSDDERTVKAWRDIVHAQLSTTQDGNIVHVPDPRPVSITRTALVSLLDIAERAIAKPTEWQAAASRLWAVEEHVNPFELLDAQLDMLERMWDVENGAVRAKGWRKPEGAIVVARPSKWGDPHRVGVGSMRTRADAVECFREDLTEALHHATRTTIPIDFRIIAESLDELRGHHLACWCPLTDGDGNRTPCHADVLLALANPKAAADG